MVPSGLDRLFCPAGMIPGTAFAAIAGVMRSQAGLPEVADGGPLWVPGWEHPARTSARTAPRKACRGRFPPG